MVIHDSTDFHNFVLFERGMNALQCRYKRVHFNPAMSPLCLVKLKITKTADSLLQCVLLNRIVPDISRMSFNNIDCCNDAEQ